jgi:tetratricopeptide (TPR) repeat protein
MNEKLEKQIKVLINKFNGGKFQEVIDQGILILKKEDNDFLWNLVGLSFQNINKYVESIKSFEIAIKINPKNIASINNLGISYKILKQYKKAEEWSNKALNLNTEYINAIVNLANIKNETYYYNDAINLYRRAIDLEKNNPLIYYNLANIYSSMNDMKESKKLLNKAITIDNKFTAADLKLSLITNYNEDDIHSKQILEKLKKLNLNNKNKINLYFALSKIYEDQEKLEESIKFMNLGNELQRKDLSFNFIKIRDYVNFLNKIYSKINFKKIQQKKHGKNLIFIMGMPRSGTTLIEKVLSSHSKTCSAGEINILSSIFLKELKSIDLNDDISLNKFLEKDIYNEYLSTLKNYNLNDEIIIDKSLNNFWYLGLIKIFFPESKIIHSNRNKGENCLSIYKNHFDKQDAWQYDKKELSEYYDLHKDIMNYWYDIFNEEILNFKYENIVADQNLMTKKLLNFCNLDWDENCINFYDNASPIKTLSINQTNKPIYKSSVEAKNIYKNKFTEFFN